MATAKEYAFANDCAKAAGVRQAAYAAAFTAYGYVQANYATYVTALVTADNAYVDAVQTSATTNGISPEVVPDLPGVFGNSVASILS